MIITEVFIFLLLTGAKHLHCPGGDSKVIIKDQSLACKQALLASLRVELTSLLTVQNKANCEQLENLA